LLSNFKKVLPKSCRLFLFLQGTTLGKVKQVCLFEKT